MAIQVKLSPGSAHSHRIIWFSNRTNFRYSQTRPAHAQFLELSVNGTAAFWAAMAASTGLSAAFVGLLVLSILEIQCTPVPDYGI